MKKVISVCLLFQVFFCNVFIHAQQTIEENNRMLKGTWVWRQCIPNQPSRECFEQPSDRLSRSIHFSIDEDSDSLIYETYINDTLIASGKIIVDETNAWTIYADMIFGEDSIPFIRRGDTIYINKCIITGCSLSFYDKWIFVRLGTWRSDMAYQYEKLSSNPVCEQTIALSMPYIRNITCDRGRLQIRVNVPGSERNNMLKIINLQGVSIFEKMIPGTGEWTIQGPDNLPPGLYLCTLFSHKYMVDIQKIVVIEPKD